MAAVTWYYSCNFQYPRDNAEVTRGGTLTVSGSYSINGVSSSTITTRPTSKSIQCQFGHGHSGTTLTTPIGSVITVGSTSSASGNGSYYSGSFSKSVAVPDTDATNGSYTIDCVRVWLGSSSSPNDVIVVPLTQTGGVLTWQHVIQE